MCCIYRFFCKDRSHSSWPPCNCFVSEWKFVGHRGGLCRCLGHPAFFCTFVVSCKGLHELNITSPFRSRLLSMMLGLRIPLLVAFPSSSVLHWVFFHFRLFIFTEDLWTGKFSTMFVCVFCLVAIFLKGHSSSATTLCAAFSSIHWDKNLSIYFFDFFFPVNCICSCNWLCRLIFVNKRSFFFFEQVNKRIWIFYVMYIFVAQQIFRAIPKDIKCWKVVDYD